MYSIQLYNTEIYPVYTLHNCITLKYTLKKPYITVFYCKLPCIYPTQLLYVKIFCVYLLYNCR